MGSGTTEKRLKRRFHIVGLERWREGTIVKGFMRPLEMLKVKDRISHEPFQRHAALLTS